MTLTPILVGLLYSPMVFISLRLDYANHLFYPYVIAALWPVLFIRRKRELVGPLLLSCAVSSILATVYMENTGTYFYPFDRLKPTMVCGLSLLFWALQALLLLTGSWVRKYLSGSKK